MSDQAGSLVTRATLGKTKTQYAVPVGASLPTDSRAASFLMTLPSEMRNLIYEALFGSNGRLECTKGSIGHEGRRWYEETSPSLRGSTALSRSEIALATPFLRSCRQVYHEAVGFLYSHNEFTLRPNTPMPAFDTWYRELGSQIILVRKVFVSVYALRGTVHVAGHYPNRVEILPILRLLWATGSSKLDIAITMDVTATSNPYFHHWDGAYLNRVPLLLGPENSMDIRKYDRLGCSHLFKSILTEDRVRSDLQGQMENRSPDTGTQYLMTVRQQLQHRMKRHRSVLKGYLLRSTRRS
jgi:hypothetical protein